MSNRSSRKDLESEIQRIEKSFLEAKNFKEADPKVLNLPNYEDVRTEYKAKVKNLDYWHYIHSADYHYFISRILFMNYILIRN